MEGGFESKCFKANLGKTKVNWGSITKEGMSKEKMIHVRLAARVKVASGWCLQCDKRIHGRCARVKRVTPKMSRNHTYRKYEGNIGEAVEQEVKLCD